MNRIVNSDQFASVAAAKMKHPLTRRDLIKGSAAGIFAAGLAGCQGQKPEAPAVPPPTLGWETIASGDEGPGPRSRHELVYDRQANVAILFGGIIWDPPRKLCSDTWELRGKEWRRVRTSDSPTPRHRSAMVYLPDRGQSLLFGGQGNQGEFLGDTWLYFGRAWHRSRSDDTSPAPRCGHSLAFDEQQGVAVLFGGVGPGDRPFGDTWIFEGNNWKQIVVSAPDARRYAAFAYDPDLKGCLLHGGSEDDHSRHSYGDAWVFQDGRWTRLPKTFETEPRDDHGLAYHKVAKRLVMLEGVAGKRGVLKGDSSGWTAIAVNPLHPRHQCSPLAWDDELGGLLMHGGEVRHKGPQFDSTLLLRMPAAT